MKGEKTVSEVLRKAIKDSGETIYKVAKDSGVPYATVHRFLTGKRTVNIATVDKLCAYLGLRLTR
jgi:plasmid maintenance system antidote protein VapI